MKKHNSISVFLLAVGFLVSANSFVYAGSVSFKELLGTWGGEGLYELKSGAKERVQCKGYYTGNPTQLGMVIQCSNDNQKIEMRSKLSQAGGKITGKWEERTYNAEGNISGSADGRKIQLSISGAITGSMDVSYSRVRQDVKILTEGTDLKSINITLTRR